MEAAPLVSVLMPCYNEESYLLEAVQSVVQQSYKQWELVIVDDGSSSKTKELIEQCKNLDSRFVPLFSPKSSKVMVSRIKVFSLFTNSGIVAAMNLGLKHCRGEYIARMDSDDVATTDRLQYVHSL